MARSNVFRMSRRWAMLGVVVVVTALVMTMIWRDLFVVGESGLQLDGPRAPTDVPVWLSDLGSGVQLQGQHDGARWTEQQFCTQVDGAGGATSEGVQRLRSIISRHIHTSLEETGRIPIRPDGSDELACVFIGQTPWELFPQFESMRPVTVDGVSGFVGELSEDVLSGRADLYEPLRFHPDDGLQNDHRLYREIAWLRGPERQLLGGPATVVWWNKDGIHYVIIGQSKPPITEDVLLRMANSLELARPLER